MPNASASATRHNPREQWMAVVKLGFLRPDIQFYTKQYVKLYFLLNRSQELLDEVSHILLIFLLFASSLILSSPFSTSLGLTFRIVTNNKLTEQQNELTPDVLLQDESRFHELF